MNIFIQSSYLLVRSVPIGLRLCFGELFVSRIASRETRNRLLLAIVTEIRHMTYVTHLVHHSFKVVSHHNDTPDIAQSRLCANVKHEVASLRPHIQKRLLAHTFSSHMKHICRHPLLCQAQQE